MSREQLVDLVDVRDLTDALSPQEALDLLRTAAPGRAAREAELLEPGCPAHHEHLVTPALPEHARCVTPTARGTGTHRLDASLLEHARPRCG